MPPVRIKGLIHTRAVGKQVAQGQVFLLEGLCCHPPGRWLVTRRVTDRILLLQRTVVNQQFSCVLQHRSACNRSENLQDIGNQVSFYSAR